MSASCFILLNPKLLSYSNISRYHCLLQPRTRTTRSQKDYLVPCYLPHERVASPARVTPSPEYTDVDVVEMDKDRRKQAKARSPTSPTPLQPPRSPAQSRAHPGSKPVGRVQPSVIPISHPDQNKQPIIPPHPGVFCLFFCFLRLPTDMRRHKDKQCFFLMILFSF